MATQSDEVKQRIISVASEGLTAIEQYFTGEQEDAVKVGMAFKILNQATKVMHMEQVNRLTERSQALRLLPWLKDDKTRSEYMRAMNPHAPPLLLRKPEKKTKKSD